MINLSGSVNTGVKFVLFLENILYIIDDRYGNQVNCFQMRSYHSFLCMINEIVAFS